MADLDGLVVVDKPGGWTSHDVVARIRRLAGTRRVGHAGTLDPMATGVLVVGVGKATKLLGHLALTEKEYDATIRLGATTVTDDAEGEVTATADASAVTDAAVADGVAALTGPIQQVPSAVSAVKIDGVRSYHRVRSGENVELPPRDVVVSRFDVLASRREGEFLDLDVTVVCSSGTYIRALARDLGASLGVGGHLTALRRTAVGPYGLAAAHTLEALAEEFVLLPIAEAAAAAFPRLDVDADTAGKVAHGMPLPATGLGPGPVAVFAPDGTLLSLAEDRGSRAKHLAVFV
ncbi:tRNA pseudouridine(55) synthase TruB [Jiangella mangrovi]|uniref:tRNA pseudouridine synthase B n=1 Tax=Jiangella mangrovi TaxID=1524084 RepID=A0A7W9LN21_9ACTN|nr:tRNA pseudouridine55 synthase [Jiangella mangrovi]